MVCHPPHRLPHVVVYERRHGQSPREQLEDCDTGPKRLARLGPGPGSTEGDYINWLTFSDNATSVVEDVARIRNHPLFPNDIPIYGYIYD
jgi:carbonic anhydrase